MNKLIVTGIGLVTLATTGTLTDAQLNPYTDKGSFVETTVAEDKVTIDKTTSQVNLEVWQGENTISVKPVGAYQEASRPILTNRMESVSDDGKSKLVIEPIENGINIDTILNEKPDTNVVSYEISGWEDFDFFYQHGLKDIPQPGNYICTDTECFDGKKLMGFRPENVVGSYAVYHKTKKNHIDGQTNYATGKAFHIYRPKIIANDGQEVWGVLSYENGVLSVTVPQDFLDKVEYPIKIDPTFGYTTVGASLQFVGGNAQGSAATMNAENGTLTKFTFYGSRDGGTDGDTIAALYSDSGGIPYALLATQSAATLINSGTAQWWDINMNSYSLIASTLYHLQIQMDAAGMSGGGLYYYDSVTDKLEAGTATYPTWDDPYVFFANFAQLMSLYATYTASGGGGATTSDIIMFE